MRLLPALFLTAALFLAACGRNSAHETPLTVAGAANLTDVLPQLGQAFQKKTGTKVMISFGSTAQLSQQIENGAPFDLFASADAEHVSALAAQQKVDSKSCAVYALGQLVLWSPAEGLKIEKLQDLATPQIHFIAIPQPELAPYGRAAVEALKSAGLWDQISPKVVYASSVSMAKQLAATGNADVAFTAQSLVLREPGKMVRIAASLYSPIEQELGIVAATKHTSEATSFREFMLGQEGRAILAQNGYLPPPPR